MDANAFLSRQPILDRQEKTVLYDLFYLDRNHNSEFIDDRYATASVLTAVLNKFGLKNIVGDHSALIKADRSFLMHDLIFSIPKEYFVIALLEQVNVDAAVLERLTKLHNQGYRLALNDIALTEANLSRYQDMWHILDYIKVDVARTGINLIEQMLPKLDSFKGFKIAAQVESTEEFEQCKALGFDGFQGYYFAKPKIMNHATLDVSQVSVLRLTSMLMSENTEVDEIVTEFEHNYALTIQLLKFINSGAFHFKQKLTSIKHILTLLGRQKLMEWLLLMIYAKSIVNNPSMDSPLLLMVKNRTELMTKLLEKVTPDATKEYRSEAYFVAVLSLSDTLFSVSKEMILNELNVDDVVRDALLYGKGQLGEIYNIVRDIEQLRSANIEAFIEKYQLDRDAIALIASESMSHVNELEASLKYDAMITD